MPYAFQLLSLMLELHDQTIPPSYYELFPFLMLPVLWERPGYIPALTRLLQAYIEKASSTLVTEKIVKLYFFEFKINHLHQKNPKIFFLDCCIGCVSTFACFKNKRSFRLLHIE
jgi:hypothetical protein